MNGKQTWNLLSTNWTKSYRVLLKCGVMVTRFLERYSTEVKATMDENFFKKELLLISYKEKVAKNITGEQGTFISVIHKGCFFSEFF